MAKAKGKRTLALSVETMRKLEEISQGDVEATITGMIQQRWMMKIGRLQTASRRRGKK